MRTDPNCVSFTVDHAPTPKPVGPRTKRSSSGWTRYLAFKRHVGLIANRHFKSPIVGPVQLSVAFYLPFPRGRSLHDHRSARRGELVPIGKPDLKNLLAATEDALTKIAWTDDAAVVQYGILLKRYAVECPPQCVVAVCHLPDGLVTPNFRRIEREIGFSLRPSATGDVKI